MTRLLSARQAFLTRITVLLFVFVFLVPVLIVLKANLGVRAQKVLDGSETPAVFNFYNQAPIIINDLSAADLYPSVVSANGSGEIVDVRVDLNDLTHSRTADIDVLLVGPTGLRSMIVSDAGSIGTTNANPRFDQDAGQQVPFPIALGTPLPIVSNRYQPTNYSDPLDGNIDMFPAPGPGNLDSEPANLDVFLGTDYGGTWSLFVVDDSINESGEIAKGWTLHIATKGIRAIVTTGDDHDDGTCDSDCTLREAFVRTDANLITVAPDVLACFLDDPLVINRHVNVVLVNPSTGNRTVVDGSGITSEPAFQILADTAVTIQGAEIINSPDGAIGNQGDLTVENSEIRNNTGGDGAAILNVEGNIAVINTTIRDNHSEFFGVIEVVDGSAILNGVSMFDNSSGVGILDLFFGSASVTNSTIANNLTKVGEGGGIALSGDSTAKVESSTIVGTLQR